MSASILHFTPRDELEPAANLRAFIKLCRESEVLGAKEQFAKTVSYTHLTLPTKRIV